MANLQPNPTLTEDEFHEAVHNNIGTPTKKYVSQGPQKTRSRQAVSKEHLYEWVQSKVNLKAKTIHVVVFLDFKKGSLTSVEFAKLKKLAEMGIGDYWSRKVVLKGEVYSVFVTTSYRKKNSIDVLLKIENEPDYARSHNSGLIDATFIYNKGFFKTKPGLADTVFKHTAAHEFGHSVLHYFGGASLSGGIKGRQAC